MTKPHDETDDRNPLGLEPYQGCAVTEVGVVITNAGGGLHAPLEVDQMVSSDLGAVQIGDTKFFLLRCDCIKAEYETITGAEDERKYVPKFRCTDATIVDGDWAIDAINAQWDRIRVAKLKQEEAAGITHLPFPS